MEEQRSPYLIEKFRFENKFKSGFKLISSMTFDGIDEMCLNLMYIDNVTKEPRRVRFVISPYYVFDLNEIIGLEFLSLHIVEHVLVEVFNGNTVYSFDSLRKHNEEFIEFMDGLVDNVKNVLDEFVSSKKSIKRS